MMSSSSEVEMSSLDDPASSPASRFEVVATPSPEPTPLDLHQPANGAAVSRQHSNESEENELDISVDSTVSVHSDAHGGRAHEMATPSPYMPPRKVSMAPGTKEETAGETSRKTSLSQKIRNKRASLVLTPKPLKHYLKTEVLPHSDHYRNRKSFIKGQSCVKATVIKFSWENQIDLKLRYARQE